MELSSRDVFVKQTIEALAADLPETLVLGETGTTGPRPSVRQAPVSGPVETTPVLEWFFDTHPLAPHHFMMSMGFTLAPDTDLAALRATVEALVAHHDALRTVIDVDDTRRTVRIEPALGEAEVLTVIDLFDGQDPEAKWERCVREAQSSVDLARGPLIRVLVAPEDTRLRVVMTAHHAVVDGVSWRILLSDLAAGYAQAAAGAEIDLGAKTTSVRQWASRLREHVRAGGFSEQVGYWADAVGPDVSVEVPVDGTGGRNTVGSMGSVSVSLDVERTRALVQRVPAVYRTQANDVLLAALALTLREWTGRDRVAVAMEGHGREELFEGVDLSRTVGWFTSVYPVALSVPGEPAGGVDWSVVVKSVKEQLRAVPDRGVGYGALRYLGAVPELVGQPAPAVSFNYHGQFTLDNTKAAGEDGFYRAGMSVPGQDHHPDEQRPHLLDVVGAIEDGRLTFSWFYSTDRH
ncbi:condensation domain-containing protein, partial [Actinoalloteichus spitiensis]|uniref:condensation domain-containing protein n=1 Tax=Actinoalloteichus spitiensis TaxID=252394 RepID=UPI001FE21B5E